MALINVPLAGQTLAQTQNPIRANFATIRAAFIVDHVDYNTAGQGQHNQVTFPLQVITPTFLGLNGLWSETYAVTTQREIWANVVHGAIPPTDQIPFTASVLSNNPIPGNFSRGWTLLPSGILMKWGRNASGIAFNLNGVAGEPNFAEVYSAALAPFTNAATTTGYTLNPVGTFPMAVYSGSAVQVSWVVYGKGA